MFLWLKLWWQKRQLLGQDPRKRAAAVQALIQTGDGRAAKVLLAHVPKERQPEILAQLARGLGLLLKEQAIPALLRMARTAEESVGQAVLATLEQIDQRWTARPSTHEAIPDLVRALLHPQERPGAVAVLTRIQDARVATEIIALFAANANGPQQGPGQGAEPGFYQAVCRVLPDALRRAVAEQGSRPLEVLKELLHGRDNAVQVQVIDILTITGGRDVLKLIVGGVRLSQARHAAVAALTRLKDPATVPLLLDLLPDPDLEVYQSVRSLLADVDPGWARRDHIAPALPRLRRGLTEGNEGARRQTAEFLGELGDVGAIGPLVALLADPAETLRRTALQVLSRINPSWETTDAARSAVPQLVQGLREGPTRAVAAETLCKLKDPAAVPLILALPETGDAEGNRTATAVLAACDPHWQASPAVRKALRPVLEAWWSHGQALPFWVTAVQERAAAELLCPVKEALLTGYKDKNARLWFRAHDSFLSIGLQCPNDLLQWLSHDGHPAMREMAANGLGRVMSASSPTAPHETILNAVIAALHDPVDSHVQRSAARALGQSRDRGAVAPLLAALGGSKDYYLREAVATALGMIGHADATDALSALLTDRSDKVVQVAAAKALIQVLQEEAVDLLLEAAVKYHNACLQPHCYAALVRFRPGDTQNRTGDVSLLYLRHLSWRERIDSLNQNQLVQELHALCRKVVDPGKGSVTDISAVAQMQQAKLNLLDKGVELDDFLRRFAECFPFCEAQLLADSWGIGGFWRWR